MKAWIVSLGLGFTLFTLTGCTTTEAVKAKPLKAVYGEGVDLARFDVLTVQPFEGPGVDPAATGTAVAEAPGVTFANAIAQRLQSDFGQLFREVRVGTPTGAGNEAVVTGRITEYRPGNRAARLIGPGIGRAELQGELVVKDAGTDQPLIIAPVDKLWAWGHAIGAAKGIEDMMEESAAAAANMIARAKGWRPGERVPVYRNDG